MHKGLRKKELKLVVLVPAFNEGNTVAKVIRLVPRKIIGISEVLVFLVDDGSTDNTVKEAYEAGVDFVVCHPVNQGVGQSFRDGVNKALEMGADILVNIDADNQHNPSDIPRLLTPILSEGFDVVVGSRYLDGLKLDMPRIKAIGNNFFTRLVSWITGVRLTDTQSGFRAFSREAALKLNTYGKFTYTQESLIQLAIKGLKIKEVPINVNRRDGKSKVVRHWYSYGLRAIGTIIRSLKDYRPLFFFGTLALMAWATAFSTGSMVFIHWLITGRTFPYTSLIDFVVLSALAGLGLMVMAIAGDMMSRQRKVQEETLYHIKWLHYDKMIKDRENDR